MKKDFGYKRYRKQFHKARYVRRRNPSRVGKSQVATHFFKRTAVKTIDVYDDAFKRLNLTTVENVFKLEDLPNYTEFTALYDTYKICGIKLKFMFANNVATVGDPLTPYGTLTQSLPNLLTVNDYNGGVLSNEADMLQYATFKSTRLDKITSRYFRPCQDVDTSNTNVVKSRWNSTSQPDIVHRGIQCAVSSSLAGSGEHPQGKLKVYATYYLAMRTPK